MKGLAVVAVVALAALAANADDGFRVRPSAAIRGGGWEAGIKVSWGWGPGGAKGEEARAKSEERRSEVGGRRSEPTRDAAGRTCYVERAVPLWRPVAGELVAAAGAGISDINAAVVGRDEAPRVPAEWPMWRRAVAHVGRHLEYRQTEYTVGGIVAAVVGAVGAAIVEEQRGDDGAAATPEPAKDAALVVSGVGNTVTLTDETGAANGQIYISGQNNTVTVTRRPPEEE